MFVLSRTIEYLFSVLWTTSENEKIDPLINQILSILNKSFEFQDIMIQHRLQNVKINYRLLTEEECKKKNISTAALEITQSLFASEKNEILLNNTLPLEKLVRGTLIETCNISYRAEYADISSRAKYGEFNANNYVKSMEKIEWKAFKQSVSIAKTIDTLKFFKNELYSINEQNASNTFEKYYQMSEKFGHVEKYRNQWSALIPSTTTLLERASQACLLAVTIVVVAHKISTFMKVR
ncbi:MAG: hypothetical protein H0T62_10875 [Parachlamydiaceae bacterium]|nr:hypothetical protein [Parachlamydiaceae bacterium]